MSGSDDKSGPMLSAPRTLEFVRLNSILNHLGVTRDDLPAIVAKELLDNALDEAKGLVLIEIKVEGGRTFISVSNPTSPHSHSFNIEEIKRAVDPKLMSSTKKWVLLTKRGALGGGLKYVVGIPYALAFEKLEPTDFKSLTIETGKGKFEIYWRGVSQNSITPEVVKVGEGVKRRTTVTSNLPPLSEDEEDKLLEIVRKIALFNPNVEFWFNGEEEIAPRGGCTRLYSGHTNASWYDYNAIRDLVVTAASEGMSMGEFGELFGFPIDGQLTVNDENIIKEIYNLFHSVSPPTSPSSLGAIGRKALKKGLIDLYDIYPNTFRYAIETDSISTEGRTIPYVVEFAFGIKHDGDTEIITGVNGTPTLDNPFADCYFSRVRPNKDDAGWHGIYGPLDEYHVEQGVLVVHVITPFPAWQGIGKNRFDAEEYVDGLEDFMAKYFKGFKGKMARLKGTNSSVPQIGILRNYLCERKQAVERDPTLLETDRKTQSSVWYDLQPIFRENGVEADRKYITSAISSECIRLGVSRDELGIIASERSQFFFLGVHYPISFKQIDSLIKKGVVILIIEKEGVAEAVSPFLELYGIGIINSRGFLQEYSNRVASGASESGAGIAILTDYDAPGILISMKAKEITQAVQRIGVDPKMIKEFGFTLSDVEEALSQKAQVDVSRTIKSIYNRMNPKWEAYFSSHGISLEYLAKKRVEIDSMLRMEGGAKKLAEHLLNKLNSMFPVKNYNRALEVPTAVLPDEIESIFSLIGKKVEVAQASERGRIIEEQETMSSFVDVEEKEDLNEKRLKEAAVNNKGVKRIIEELRQVDLEF